MTARRDNLTAMKFKKPRSSDTPERRALVLFRPACARLDDEGIQSVWASLSEQTRQQYLRGLDDLDKAGKADATTTKTSKKTKADK